MCRLFGMTAGTAAVGATFWLLDAPDSLEAQSRRNVDGSGIGFFDPAGHPLLDKQPEPAFSDEEFIREAKQAVSTTFVAHVRWATAGGRTMRNTHPFAMHGRIMAHNGGFGDLSRLDYQLGTYRKLVLGDTDSERYFALITQQVDAHGGDVGAGITAAARWIGEHLPVSSLNAIVTAPGCPASATVSASSAACSGLALSTVCLIPRLVRRSDRSSETSTEMVPTSTG